MESPSQSSLDMPKVVSSKEASSQLLVEGHNRQKPKVTKPSEIVSKSMEPVPKKKITTKPKVDVKAKQSDSDYDEDDFEKEDIVKMAEPANHAPTAASKAR